MRVQCGCPSLGKSTGLHALYNAPSPVAPSQPGALLRGAPYRKFHAPHTNVPPSCLSLSRNIGNPLTNVKTKDGVFREISHPTALPPGMSAPHGPALGSRCCTSLSTALRKH